MFRALARQRENARFYFLCRQYTDLFIFRFVCEHCLRSTLRLFHLHHLDTKQSDNGKAGIAREFELDYSLLRKYRRTMSR